MSDIELYKLIQLKQKYGSIYVYQEKGRYIVQRQPTLREIKQQLDIQNTFKLNTYEMFVELAKQLIVIPENPEDVSRQQIDYIAERLLDDVPTTEKEFEQFAAKQIDDNDNAHDLVAVELWSQIQGTTVDQFYDVPITDLIKMYAYIRSMQEMESIVSNMQQQQQQQYKQPGYSLNELEDILTGKKQPDMNTVKVKPEQTDNVKQFFGKSIDEVFEMLSKGGNKENG